MSTPADDAAAGDAAVDDDVPGNTTARDTTDQRAAGDPIVALEALRGRPLAEHADGYERIHEQLQATLAAIDTR